MSLANYIIICDGRINLQAAHNTTEKIQAASRCATEFVKHNSAALTLADTTPVSELQHDMMDLLSGKQLINVRSADEMVVEMFALLDALEDKLESKQDSP